MRKLRPLALWANFLLFSAQAPAQVVINELMSNNRSTIQDADGDYSDWIELYNPGPASVDLQGYYLSDNIDSLLKWRFPTRVVGAGGYVRVWCSGKNRAVAGSSLHTNFSLSSQGETIFLSDSFGVVIDNVPAVYLPADKTYGRYPNGSSTLVYLSGPTPLASNNLASPLQGIIAGTPLFNYPGGFYTDSIYLSLTHPDPNVIIRYTLDGSDPTNSSPMFIAPLLIKNRDADTNYYSMIRTCYRVHFWLPDWNPPIGNVFKATVVRAAAFRSGYLQGPTQTYTYFVDDSIFGRYGNLPVISVVSDPKNLFNDTTGIYVPGINYVPGTFQANYYMPWDRPANIEMYLPDGRMAFNSNFKIDVNGQSSQSSPQKALNVNASSDYGISKINYPLFENTTGPTRYIASFDKIKLRAWGSDRDKALFRDAYCSKFMEKTDLDFEAYRPVVVFIDGEYWGLQEMRERDRDKGYYESHYLINAKNPGFDILDGAGANVLEGDSLHWTAMMDFIATHPISDSANYAYLKTQMDVNSFMLHYLFSIYMSRSDWPDQNEAKWRPRTADGKWKWIMWDMDATVAYYLNPWYDMFAQAITGSRGYGPSDLLDSLLSNTEFKNNWINLFADFMNTEFLPPLMQAQVDSLSGQLLPYFPEFQNRWQTNYNWQAQTDSMKWWVGLRPQFCKSQIVSTFALPGYNNLHLNVSDTLKGKIQVNTVVLNNSTKRITTHTYPWTGQYFQTVPVPLTATAFPGYRFVKWLPTNDTAAAILVTLNSDTSFTAVFDVDTNYIPLLPPVINEVMSSNLSAIADNYGQYDDWIELYNPNDDTLDVGGLYLTDNLVLPTLFRIASGNDSTKIPPHSFLLLWADNDPEQGVLHANFKLSSASDLVVLYAADGETVLDSIRFGAIGADISYGRNYDASPQWILFPVSTPHATNVTSPAANLLINEVMTLNTSVIADEHGDFDPWIEIYNPTTDTLDLAGWYMTNNAGVPQKFRFPFGNDSTKVAPDGFLLLWGDGQKDQGVCHLNFSMDVSGDCILLYKPDDTTLSDYLCVGGLSANISRGRSYDGSPQWIDFFVSTPNATNQSSPAENVLINEVLTNNLTSVTDEYGQHEEWIELYNPNNDTLDLAGWSITNNLSVPKKFRFVHGNDSTKIAPHSYMMLWADNQTGQGVRHLNFRLNNTGECLYLFKPNHTSVSDSVCYSSLLTDQSYGRSHDAAPDWITFVVPTPNATNWIYTSEMIVINEVLSDNVGSVTDEYGQHEDWIELYNPNNDTLNLAGWSLTNDPLFPGKFRFAYGNDSTKIAPHDFMLLWADNQPGQGVRHTGFTLSSAGECVYLFKPDQASLSDSICFGALATDVSLGRRHDAAPDWITFVVPTPDATNWMYTSETIYINEVQPLNVSTEADNYGQFDPWIELYNPNADTLNIEGWYFSNDPFNTSKFKFAYDNDSTRIPPFGFLLLWGDNQTYQGDLHLNFLPDPAGNCLALYKPDFNFVDSVCYNAVGADHSWGRVSDGNSSWMEFVIPTPDSNNVDLSINIHTISSTQSLFVYPNPVHDGTVYFNRPLTFSLTDALGRELLFATEQRELNLSGLGKGIYLLKTDKGEIVKLVVQ